MSVEPDPRSDLHEYEIDGATWIVEHRPAREDGTVPTPHVWTREGRGLVIQSPSHRSVSIADAAEKLISKLSGRASAGVAAAWIGEDDVWPDDPATDRDGMLSLVRLRAEQARDLADVDPDDAVLILDEARRLFEIVREDMETSRQTAALRGNSVPVGRPSKDADVPLAQAVDAYVAKHPGAKIKEALAQAVDASPELTEAYGPDPSHGRLYQARRRGQTKMATKSRA